MSATTALLDTALQVVKVRTPAGEEVLTPPTDGPAQARSFREAAFQAADWVSARRGLRKRLDYVVVDVDESLFRWIRSSSLARPVLNATVRSHMAEWDGVANAGAIEPIVDVAKPKAGPKRRRADDPDDDAPSPTTTLQEGVGVPVIMMPDAIVRLWLDRLDRRGVRVNTVMSLWHAMARAFAHATPVLHAILLVEPDERIVWAWAKGADLEAGGVLRLERGRPGADAAEAEPGAAAEPDDYRMPIKRLALEWLTWSAQLGDLPERVTVVGPDAAAMARRIEHEWPGVQAVAQACDDAPDAVLTRLTASKHGAGGGTEGARRSLVGLTNRPTRAVRRAYRFVGLALLLVGAAIFGLSWQMKRQARDWAQERVQAESEALDRIKTAEPTVAATSLATAGAELRKLLDQEEKREPIDLPRPPHNLFAEAQAVLSVLTEYEKDAAYINSIDLKTPGSSTLALWVDDPFRTGVLVTEGLNAASRWITWEERRNARGNSYNLTGTWEFAPK